MFPQFQCGSPATSDSLPTYWSRLTGVVGGRVHLLRILIGMRGYRRPAVLLALTVLFVFACVSSPATDLPILDTETGDDEPRFSASTDLLLVSAASAPLLVAKLVSTVPGCEYVKNRMTARRSCPRGASPLLLAVSILLFFSIGLVVLLRVSKRRNSYTDVHEFIRSHIGEKRFADGSLASFLARFSHGFKVTVPFAALSLLFLDAAHSFPCRAASAADLACRIEGGIQP
ncbi:MAG TPA: hypothetical protein VIV15_07435 [Anaerolineales bacterium]